MPSDYEAIRRDHERLYGEAVGEYGGILAELYADRTHFVFELLQNAQDAGAARIVFELQPDRLEVQRTAGSSPSPTCGASARSNARPSWTWTSSRSDALGSDSSRSTRTPPGRFRCGDEHFVITDYVHPHAVEAIEESGWWTTLRLPFRSRRGDGRGGCRAESGRASPSSARARSSSCAICASSRGRWPPRRAGRFCARKWTTAMLVVRLLHGNLAADAEEWLFDQPVELVDRRPPNRVEIASSASQRTRGIASWSQTEPSWSRSSHESRDASRFPDSRPVCSYSRPRQRSRGQRRQRAPRR